ncbi:MAG: DUF2752 domain-containing protein [Actinobacteria bacterium]|nr:DUF2752 domain-containing protein [Actinomycetota bacterium]
MTAQAGFVAPPTGSRSGLHVDDVDRMWSYTSVALLFTGGAVALRIFGLPGIDIHGPLHRLGVMDPFCGGTRGTYQLALGNVGAAWSWNPIAVLLGVGAVLFLARAAVGRVTHRWLNLALPRRWVLSAVALVLVVVEVNQQLQADRLRGR